MIIILSPSKTMDMKGAKSSDSNFLEETHSLIKILKTFSPEALSKLMKIKGKLLDSVVNIYNEFDDSPLKPSIEAYTGFVFKGLDLNNYSKEEKDFLDNHFIILSALYGCLFPYTEIKKYRLDMTMKVDAKNSLYDYWKVNINSSLIKTMSDKNEKFLINLASTEFSKLIDRKSFPSNIIDIDFKEEKNGNFKSVSTYAKKARGLMANYIVKNKIEDLEVLKKFTDENYSFNEELSSEKNYVFTRSGG